MLKPPLSRKFGKKRYVRAYTFQNKAFAIFHAQKLHKEGVLAKVVGNEVWIGVGK